MSLKGANNMKDSLTIHELNIGDSRSITIKLDEENVDAFAKAIQQALSFIWNPALIREVVLSKFTWQLYAENMMALYRSISS